MPDSQAILSSYTGARPETTIVKVDGVFTLPSIFAFQEKIAFLKTNQLISVWIVDVSGVPYMDSAGLGCLINLYVAGEKNHQKVLLAGANHRVGALLETAKVHNLLRNYATVADAEATLKA